LIQVSLELGQFQVIMEQNYIVDKGLPF